MKRHCHAHPSREADLRCRVCGHWLCDSCAQVRDLHIYCGGRCLRRDRLRRAAHVARTIATRRVPAPWALAVTLGLSALLLAAVGLRVAELLEVTGVAPAPVPARSEAAPRVTGTLERRGRQWQLLLHGRPQAAVLVTADEHPAVVITLGAAGHAVVDLGPKATPPAVRLYPLPTGVAATLATPTPTPAPTSTPRPAATPPPPPSSQPPTPTTAAPTPSRAQTTTPVSATRVPAPPDVHLVTDAGNRLALTFDGSSAVSTSSEVLDLLHELHVHATLFVTGEYIEAAPGLVRRALVEGHEVGNHTFSHPHLTTYAENRRQTLRPEVTRERFLAQLRDTEAAFYRATGRHMAPYWRAPFGEENTTLRAWALELGYLHVRWSSLRGASLDSRDWVEDEHSPLYEDAPRMMRRLLRFPELSGGIILMHLGSGRERPAWRVLPDLIGELRRRGIKPGTVSSLLEASPAWRARLRDARARHVAAFSDTVPR